MSTNTYHTPTIALDSTAAFWYACGYNDFRLTGEPFIDGFDFARYWLSICEQPSRPSLQDAFQAFAATVAS